MSQISYAKANAPRPTLNLPKREHEGARVSSGLAAGTPRISR